MISEQVGLPQKDTKEHKKKERPEWELLCTLWTVVANHRFQRSEANSSQSQHGLSKLVAPLRRPKGRPFLLAFLFLVVAASVPAQPVTQRGTVTAKTGQVSFERPP